MLAADFIKLYKVKEAAATLFILKLYTKEGLKD
jgi:hypothetical protein